MSRFAGCIAVGCVAFWLARGIGIPVWRDWDPGDASDIGMISFWAAFWLSARHRMTPQIKRESSRETKQKDTTR